MFEYLEHRRTAWRIVTAAAGGGGDITVNVLYSGTISPSGTTAVTSSISPSANRLLLAIIGARFTGAVADNTIAVTGNGLTWERIAERQNGVRNLGIYRAMGTPSAGAVTFTESDSNAFQGLVNVIILEFQNMNTTGTNGSGAVGNEDDSAATANNITCTIPDTPAAGDVCFGALITPENATGHAPDSNWENIVVVAGGDEVYLRADWDTGQDLTSTWTWNETMGAVSMAFLIKK